MPARDYVVKIAFVSTDHLTAQVKGIKKQLHGVGRVADAMNRELSKKGNYFGQIFKSMLALQAVSSSMMMAQNAVRGVVTEFISLDDAVTAAGAKFGNIRHHTKEWMQLRDVARQVGAETEFTAAQAAEGLEFMAMAGFDAETAMKNIRLMADLATASKTDFARVTDIATDALGAFFPRADNAAEKTKRLAEISDVLTAVTNGANVTAETFYETMKDGGPVMRIAGQDLQMFGALTMIMGNAAIKGTKAGTTLKNAFIRLAAPPPKAAKALKKFGIEVAKKGNIKDFARFLEELSRKYNKMTQTQRIAFKDAVFGKRAIAGLANILEVGAGKVSEYVATLDASKGTTKRGAEATRESVGKLLATLKSSLLEKGLQIFEAFEKDFPSAIKSMTKAVRDFDVKPIVEGIRTFVDTLKALKDFAVENAEALKFLAKAFIGLKVATAAGNAVMSLATALKALTAAGGLTAAVLALVGVLGYLVAHNEDVGRQFAATFEQMRTGANKATNFISEVFGGLVGKFAGFFNSIYYGFQILMNNLKILAIQTVATLTKAFSGGVVGAAMQIITGRKIAELEQDSQRLIMEQQRANMLAQQNATEAAKRQFAGLGAQGLETFGSVGEAFGKRAKSGLTPEDARVVRDKTGGFQSIDINLANEISGLPPEVQTQTRMTTAGMARGRGIPKINMNRSGRN